MKRSLLSLIPVVLLFTHISFAQDNTKPKSFAMPGTYKFVVPKGATVLNVTLSGPGGWGGGGNGSGGNGGLVTGNLPVKEGEELIVIVGTGGAPGKASGITAIMRDKDYLAIAAGGGNGSNFGGKGGNGGPMGFGGTTGTGTFSSGNSGAGASLTGGGSGGIAGGSGSRGANGVALKGGNNNAKAVGEGWGGAGWFGGGASATYSSAFISGSPRASGGGGGGSNYTKGLTENVTNSSNKNTAGIGSNMGMNGKVDIAVIR